MVKQWIQSCAVLLHNKPCCERWVSRSQGFLPSTSIQCEVTDQDEESVEPELLTMTNAITKEIKSSLLHTCNRLVSLGDNDGFNNFCSVAMMFATLSVKSIKLLDKNAIQHSSTSINGTFWFWPYAASRQYVPCSSYYTGILDSIAFLSQSVCLGNTG